MCWSPARYRRVTLITEPDGGDGVVGVRAFLLWVTRTYEGLVSVRAEDANGARFAGSISAG